MTFTDKIPPLKPFAALPEAVDWLYDLQKFGIKFGLSSTSRLVAALGNPQEKLRFIHIAGTNGKGSVAAMVSAVLTNAGHPVGFYSSPHLVNFHERFRLKDQDISDADVLRLINEVRQVADQKELPTFFEFVTAMALLYYAQVQADPVILETGMGGRLDATNIVTPLVTVITNIAMDHREYLGNNIQAIAAEKAGIIKPGVPLITNVTQRRARIPIDAACQALKTPLLDAGQHFKTRGLGHGRFHYKGINKDYLNLQTNLIGRHQYENAALALAVIEVLQDRGFAIPESAIRQGLAQTRWPGRLECISRQPRIILDGAHNPAAAQVLAQALKNSLSYKRLVLVLGIMADKDIPGILRHLLRLANVAIFTRPAYSRAAAPEILASLGENRVIESLVVPELSTAIEHARQMAGPDDLIVITGSLFTVGEARDYLLKRQLAT